MQTVDTQGIKHFQAGTCDVTSHIISDLSRPLQVKPVVSDHSKEDNKIFKTGKCLKRQVFLIWVGWPSIIASNKQS